MLSDYKFWRKFRKGIWYYVRVTSPSDFTHMRYWINRNPVKNEEILKWEEPGNGSQRTFIFCPKCSIEMVSNNYCYEDSDLVYYECGHCGNKSTYNFDIAPVPILIKSDHVTV